MIHRAVDSITIRRYFHTNRILFDHSPSFHFVHVCIPLVPQLTCTRISMSGSDGFSSCCIALISTISPFYTECFRSLFLSFFLHARVLFSHVRDCALSGSLVLFSGTIPHLPTPCSSILPNKFHKRCSPLSVTVTRCHTCVPSYQPTKTTRTTA